MTNTHRQQNHIKAWRTARKLKQQDLADAIRRDLSVVSKIENNKIGVSSEHLLIIANVLHCEPAALYTPPPEGTRPVLPGDAAQIGTVRIPATQPDQPADWPQDVPIMGTAAGSLGEGAFQMDTADPVDYARRGPGIRNARNAYAIYVIGDSMSPRYEDGDPVFVHPDKAARPGDYVVVQMQNHENAQVQAYIKRLVRRTEQWLVLEQLNPAGELKLKADKVRAVHRVLSPGEVFAL